MALGDRAFDVLEALLASRGQLVTKDELMRRVWPGTVVEENTLEVHVSAIRKALGPERGLLRTSYGRGYRLLGEWTACGVGAPDGAAAEGAGHADLAPFRHNLPAASGELIGRIAA